MKGHIKLNLPQHLIDFSPVLRPVKYKKVPVNRNAHFAKIKSSLYSAVDDYIKSNEFTNTVLNEVDRPQKLVLTFKENTDIDERLAISTLSSHGMSLLSVNKVNGQFIANVLVPKSKIEKIGEIIEDYGCKDTASNKPKNQKFIESISEIEFGNISALWFSSLPLPNNYDEIIAVELWMSTDGESNDAVISKLEFLSEKLGITLKQGLLTFKDRLVKIACASINQLSRLQLLIESIAEIRPATTISNEFIDLSMADSFEWVDDLVVTGYNNSTAVCILDTGVNTEHPLLQRFVRNDCVIVAEPEWTIDDRQGHGTGVAGLALYGDLKIAMQNENVEVNSIIESVKILPDDGRNDPKLYGAITNDAVYTIEAIHPSSRRIFTMAVTSPYSLRGIPSSWSAAVDLLASGSPDDDNKRLFLISAGNMGPDFLKDYPDSNATSSIEDPANSYNSLTVGYWASEDNIVTEGYRLLADLSDLGPSSTTSLTWNSASPFKPDVVFEGGNFGYDDELEFPANLEELSLMTTSNNFLDGNHFATFTETSAATALASNFISKLWNQYPDYNPETIRGLVVHSASWPQKILERNLPLRNKRSVENLLRMAGYGQPNIGKAISSGDKSVNLVIEDQIQPYTDDGKMNKMILYTLPWPANELEKIGEEEVKLRITLSYFIEPNPGERGWENKYKYTSHGLRFDFNSAGEESGEFVARINKKFRNGNPEYDIGDSDSQKWLLGPMLRNRGSIHSDVWTGSALELADKKYIAIYPVSGWWKELKKENRQTSIARFSLIVSIETPENNLEIHNAISQLLNIETEIQNIITI